MRRSRPAKEEITSEFASRKDFLGLSDVEVRVKAEVGLWAEGMALGIGDDREWRFLYWTDLFTSLALQLD
jgi:hypothetical protein